MKIQVPFTYIRENRNYIEFEVKNKEEAIELIEKIKNGEVSSGDGVEIDTGYGDAYDHKLHADRPIFMYDDNGNQTEQIN